jgi:hypothetical protein
MISCLINKPYIPIGLAMIIGLKKHGYDLDGRKEMFPVSFSNLAMVVNEVRGLGAMYGCVGLMGKLLIGNDFLEGNMET